jgi:hypothetical protein
MEEILMGGLGMFLLKEGSRNSINNRRKEGYFSEHYYSLFDSRLPHQDTILDVLRQLAPENLEQVKMDLMSGLFEQNGSGSTVSRASII